MSGGQTKPCTRCGNADPKDMRRATPDRWWCTQCIRDVNRDYYDRNRREINRRRRRRRRHKMEQVLELPADQEPSSFRLLRDPTGVFRPQITEFSKSELCGLAEDRYAPTGSRWRDEYGNTYEIAGEQLVEDQTIVLIERATREESL